MNATTAPITWLYDPETREHFLPIEGNPDLAMKVYKTEAGDYAITCHSEAAGRGGEIDTERSLNLALRNAEARVTDGRWRELS